MRRHFWVLGIWKLSLQTVANKPHKLQTSYNGRGVVIPSEGGPG